RRRHTRFSRDWSSDVCSSDLRALRDIVVFWIDHGVRIFRVDNPHTKPFDFWEWLIHDIQTHHPDTIFLAEAFTRPKVMKGLAKRSEERRVGKERRCRG